MQLKDKYYYIIIIIDSIGLETLTDLHVNKIVPTYDVARFLGQRSHNDTYLRDVKTKK